MQAPLQTFHSGDSTIAYVSSGSLDAPAVVFAHAMGFDHRIWSAILPLLPQGLRLVCYDLRGHGQSSTPPAPYAMGALIRDAEALLDHLNIRECVFVGSSIGGMVAQGLAVKRLDLIRGLVLANTVTKIGTKETWARQIAKTEAEGLASRLATDLAQSFSAAFRNAQDLTTWQDILAAGRLEAFLGCSAAIAGTDFYSTTASLRLPSMVIASSEDVITPADMVRELAELIPGAQFELIRKSGHMPMIEQPETFARALVGFLYAIGHLPTLQSPRFRGNTRRGTNESQARMLPILLIHGSCHGAWCWRDVLPYLPNAVAIDLPGHGADRTPIGDVTLNRYVEAILDAITTPVHLVGHSMAGYPITAAAERAPEKIAALSYVCAYVPRSGLSLADMRRAGPDQPLLEAIESSPDRQSFAFRDALLKDRFYHDCPPGTVEFARQNLTPQAIKPQATPLIVTTRSAILPKRYILCDQDRAIPPAYQATMSQGWADIRKLNSSHSPFFSMPETLAKELS